MSAWQNLARRVRAPKHGAGEASLPANTAPVPVPAPLPAPTFTPAAPLTETRPVHVPSGRHAAPAPARQESRRPALDGDRLLRVRDGLLAHPGAAPGAAVPDRQQFEAEVQEAFRAAMRPVPDAPAPAPAPARARAARFTADMRKARSGGLPLFRETGLALGWCGLDSLTPAGQYARWSTDRWARQAMARIAAQTVAAKSEISHDFAELGERYTRAWAAADTALALGYPGSDL
jgi:hypothetical protein